MSSSQLALDTTICRRDTLLSTDLGDDVVMMDVERGAYYGLEATAARVWALTAEPISVGALCERLTAEYQIAPEQCQQEVLIFLDELLKHDILTVLTQAHT